MLPKSIFISQPSVAFSALLGACDELLDYSVTRGIDNTSKRLSDSEKFLSILSSFKGDIPATGFPPNLLTHVSFSVLTAACEADMMDILESCSGMPFVYAETKMRSIIATVITGTMQQWRDAVVAGSNHAEHSIRSCFNQIHDLFVQVGLHSVWDDYEQQPGSDGTYGFIEYKP
jgi:hypothetical protein